MAVYVIADPHWGHRNILQIRPQFSSIEEHDGHIVEKILSVCGKRDSLHILGDVCVGPRSLGSLQTIADNIEVLHVALGNHDGERRRSPSVQDLMNVCKSVYAARTYKRAWLTHIPMHPSELYGRINIHGHIHRNVIDDPRYVNVSVEAVDYAPVNIETIFERCRQQGVLLDK